MSNFSWVKIYKEIAEKIAEEIKDNDKDLIALLKGCESCQINYLKDKNENSLLKLLFMGIKNAEQKWTMRIRNWSL